MSYKFLNAFLIVCIALTLQFLVGEASGMWLSLTLAALVASAFFLDFLELITLALFSVLILNWQPAFSFEMLLLMVLPLVTFFFHKLIPFAPIVGNAILFAISIIIFYVSIGGGFIMHSPSVFFLDVLASLLLGTVACASMQSA